MAITVQSARHWLENHRRGIGAGYSNRRSASHLWLRSGILISCPNKPPTSIADPISWRAFLPNAIRCIAKTARKRNVRLARLSLWPGRPMSDSGSFGNTRACTSKRLLDCRYPGEYVSDRRPCSWSTQWTVRRFRSVAKTCLSEVLGAARAMSVNPNFPVQKCVGASWRAGSSVLECI